MAKLRIPEAAQDALGLLANLPRASVHAFKEALEHSSSAVPIGELAKTVAPIIQLAPNQVENILKVLGSMYAVRAEQDLSREKFSEDFLEAIKQTKNSAFELSPDRLTEFQHGIEELLDLDELLGVSGRAIGIMHEHEHVWQSARVLTDLRPVFASDPTRSPSAFVLIHNLRITYRKGGRNREFFVALDGTDVRKLQKLLDRAVKKEASLKAFAKNTGVSCLYSDPD